MSYFYSEPSLIRPPSVPIVFEETGNDDEDDQESLPEPAHHLPSGLFTALCSLSELFFEIMTYNSSASAVGGTPQDFARRVELYARFREWNESLPEELRAEKNFTIQTCYLQ